MVRNKKGFTLIELLIVVVIIGILAAIAIPKFAGTKSKAYVAAMKSDLKNLVLAQESYYADATPPGYGAVVPGPPSTLTSQVVAVGLIWTATTGVTITTGAVSATGYNATATHLSVPASTCGVYVGIAAPPAGAPAGIVEGEVACW